LLQQIKSKKAVSEIVSYSILIVIAVGISILVFAFLKVYIPKFQTPECPAEVHIIADNINCDFTSKKLTFTVKNRGLFSVDSVFTRLHPPGKEIKSLIPENGYKILPELLAPGNSTDLEYDFTTAGEIAGEGYTLEIQPAIFNEERKLAVCENAVATQKIACLE